jgi:hypothetical protein
LADVRLVPMTDIDSPDVPWGEPACNDEINALTALALS